MDSPTSSSASAPSPSIGTLVPESEERMERPMGKKAAKRLKKTENDAKDNECIKALTQMKDTLSRLSRVRHETVQQLIELEKERFKQLKQLIELEKERFKAVEDRERAREEREIAKEERDIWIYEMSILGIDTSSMEAPLALYYKSLKDDILEKKDLVL